MDRKLLNLLLVTLLAACSEAPLLRSDENSRLNYPVSMALIPGTDLAVVANANANLNQAQGSLIAIDLASRELLLDTRFPIPPFAGRMWVDDAEKRIYVTNKDREAVLVYDYRVPGDDGAAISFTPVKVPAPQEGTTNGLETDAGTYDIVMVEGMAEGKLLFASNIFSGSVSVLDPGTLARYDLNPDDDRKTGLPLVSAANFQDLDDAPGIGAYRFTLDPTGGRLLYVTSSQRNAIYVVDAYDRKVEAMIDLSFLSLSTGTRGIALATDGKAYVAIPALSSVAVLDVAGVQNNGINLEVVAPVVVDFIAVGRDPEAVVLSADGLSLYVLNQADSTLGIYDVATRQRRKSLLLEGASVPADLVLNAARGEIYAVNYISDSISLIDATAETFVKEIR